MMTQPTSPKRKGFIPIELKCKNSLHESCKVPQEYQTSISKRLLLGQSRHSVQPDKQYYNLQDSQIKRLG